MEDIPQNRGGDVTYRHYLQMLTEIQLCNITEWGRTIHHLVDFMTQALYLKENNPNLAYIPSV